eukprot:TRINITY_DN1333_c0_g1_i6.p1 TRINITY_DN1333_c0_g1~~TRINITY_DN1333_c0_g1_i6.p1  ORF type:complete len:677 (-),score=99.08 TRINITY_DN1333_c0_g1_i6:48-2078(-)
MIRRPPRSTQSRSSAASDVYKRQVSTQSTWGNPTEQQTRNTMGNTTLNRERTPAPAPASGSFDEFFSLNQIEIRFSLRDLMLTTALYILYAVMLLLFLLEFISLALFLGSLVIDDLYRGIAQEIHLRKFPYKEERLRGRLIQLESLWMLLFKILLGSYIFWQPFRLSFALIPLVFHIGFRLFFCISDRNRLECAAMSDFVIMILRCFAFMQLTLVFLKLEESVTWEWKEVFWVYWFFFALMVGVVCGVLFLFISKICYYLNGQDEGQDVKTLLWFLVLVLGVNVSSCLFVWTLTDDLTQKVNPKEDSLFIIAICVLAGFLGIFLAATFAFKHTLIDFFEKMAALEEAHQEDFDGVAIRRPKKKVLKKRSASAGKGPIFLKKLSATYYKITETIGGSNKSRRRGFWAFFSNWKSGASNDDQKSFENSKQEAKPPTTKSPAVSPRLVDSIPSSARAMLTSGTGLSFSPRNATKTVPSKTNEVIPEEEYSEISPQKGIHLSMGKRFKHGHIRLTEGESNEEPNDNETKQRELSQSVIEARKRPMTEGNERDHSFINRTTIIRRSTRISLEKPKPITEFLKSPDQDKQENDLETKRLDQSVSNCLVCFDRQPDAVIMDCGHGGLCYECAVELWEKTDACYLCRKPLTQILQVDLATRAEDVLKILSYTEKVECEDGSFQK